LFKKGQAGLSRRWSAQQPGYEGRTTWNSANEWSGSPKSPLMSPSKNCKDFLEFRGDDAANLIGINDLAQIYAESVIEDFFKHLPSFEETKVFFGEPEVLERVKVRKPVQRGFAAMAATS
jgi:hypothetical protein